jgi:capsular polysaccharide biosynthesis protein
MDKEFNLIAAIRIMLKWKTPIAILVVVSGIAAALFSVFVMDEYFLSASTFYPSNQYVSDRSMIFNSQNTGGQIEYFGGKGDVNRILTIANSEPVMDFIIDSFKLIDHYKIDRNSAYYRTKVRKKLDKNYEAIKTEHDAVEISIFDTDPKLAAAIVNTVVDRVDELNKSHINETKKNLFNLISSQILEQQQNVYKYVDTLSQLATQYKIKVSSGAPGTVIVEGNDVRAVQLYKSLLAKQENTEKELNNRINIKEQMEVAMKSNTSSLFIVEKATPADRREKPVRSVVVLLTMLFTFFVSLIGVLLIEQIKQIKAQL